MRARDALDAPEALVLTMVLVAAADGGMTDREIGVMAGQVQTLPAFHDFTTEQFSTVTDAAVRLLNEDDGLQHAARLMRGALRAAAARDRLRAGVRGGRGERRGEVSGHWRCWTSSASELRLDPLIAAAIERGVRARHQRIEPSK